MYKFKEFLSENFYTPTTDDAVINAPGLHKTLLNHYQANEHSDALIGYTGYSSGINGHLHDLYRNPSRGTDREYQNEINHLDAFTTSQEAPKTFHVYTGINGDPRKVLHKAGKTSEGHHKVILPAFTSTSIDPHIANGFASRVKNHKTSEVERHMLKIEIPEGSKHGAYIDHLSTKPGEKEFLLKRNLKLHIHPEPEIERKTVFTGGQAIPQTHHIWQAKIV